jgi:hypothetical protein
MTELTSETAPDNNLYDIIENIMEIKVRMVTKKPI